MNTFLDIIENTIGLRLINDMPMKDTNEYKKFLESDDFKKLLCYENNIKYENILEIISIYKKYNNDNDITELEKIIINNIIFYILFDIYKQTNIITSIPENIITSILDKFKINMMFIWHKLTEELSKTKCDYNIAYNLFCNYITIFILEFLELFIKLKTETQNKNINDNFIDFYDINLKFRKNINSLIQKELSQNTKINRDYNIKITLNVNNFIEYCIKL